MSWLGILPKVFSAFPTIALPATILTELFEGRKRVQQMQKSRIQRAIEIERAIVRGRLKVITTAEASTGYCNTARQANSAKPKPNSIPISISPRKQKKRSESSAY
jgi:hypothetical protein